MIAPKRRFKAHLLKEMMLVKNHFSLSKIGSHFIILLNKPGHQTFSIRHHFLSQTLVTDISIKSFKESLNQQQLTQELQIAQL